jgi:dTDP-4-amino-4,6-dideoxygalactose transaminase
MTSWIKSRQGYAKKLDDTGFRPEKLLPNVVALGETSLMLLVHPSLTHLEIDKTIDVINRVFTLASKG